MALSKSKPLEFTNEIMRKKGHFSHDFLLTLSLFLLFSTAVATDYHHAVLDPNEHFHMFWKVNKQNEEITIKLVVQTTGYVSIGFSPNGAMPGSDIVIGWVKNGRAFLKDTYAYRNGIPLPDDQQDWNLLHGYENGTHTILEFSRKLDTCDSQDIPITNDTSRVIYAYHEEDPVYEDLLLYHKKQKRGSKSIVLLQPINRRDKLPKDAKIWYIRSPNITIPDDSDTTYWCKIVKAPLLNKKHHVIQIEPLVTEGNAEFVHHMVLYRCLGATARELEPHVHHTGHPCYVPDMPQTYTKCESVYAAWGAGGMALVMPENAGLPLGDKPNLYFLLEIHYDNSEFRSGIVDQSGFRVYYTPNLRRYDAMTLMIGAAVDPCIVIPPGQRKFVIAGHANPECLGPAIPPEGFRIFAVFLHSHLLGRQMKLRHFRKNIELPFIAADQRYDFNYQEYRYLSNEVVVHPGDHLVVECTYDSTGRNVTTFGGLGTGQEMCLAFILYYPRISIARSLSSATCNLVKSLAGMDPKKTDLDNENNNFTFYQHFYANDPWDSTYASIAEAAMRYGYHSTHCLSADGRRMRESGFVTYPRNVRPYTEPSRCVSPPSSQEQWRDNTIYLPSSAATFCGICVVKSLCTLFILHKIFL